MRIHLKVWRQAGPTDGRASSSTTPSRTSRPDMSFLEMLDVVNEGLIARGEDPIAFDSDCREGICGTCGFLIDGVPHGPDPGTTVCQLHMRRFKDSDRLTLEPWRAQGVPARSRISSSIAAPSIGSSRPAATRRSTSAARQDGNAILISKTIVEQAMDSAACIGCGACVAACKNASAALFTSAKVSHLALLPQGEVERQRASSAMVDRHDAEGFGSCSNEGECEAVCPKEIPITNIARMNRDYLRAMLITRD